VRLLVDQQLPIALARSLAAEGLDCAHVQDLGLDASSDAVIWHHARIEGFTIVTKDDDFQALANRHGPLRKSCGCGWATAASKRCSTASIASCPHCCKSSRLALPWSKSADLVPDAPTRPPLTATAPYRPFSESA
jgi:predicted nuclease of predicted toxin-antitoxin system